MNKIIANKNTFIVFIVAKDILQARMEYKKALQKSGNPPETLYEPPFEKPIRAQDLIKYIESKLTNKEPFAMTFINNVPFNSNQIFYLWKLFLANYAQINQKIAFIIPSKEMIPPNCEKYITVYEQEPVEKALFESFLDALKYDDSGNINAEIEKEFNRYVYENGFYLSRLFIENGYKDARERLLQSIIRETNGILEIVQYNDADEPIGLGHVIDFLKKAMESGIGKGSLLLGVPGTGKTLIAKHLSKEYRVIKFNVSRIFNKFVGESEKRMATVMQILSKIKQSFIFIDEIEKAVSYGAGDSGVSYRIFGMLLELLNEQKGNYFIGTVNNPLSLPPEFLRPGRFDVIFSFGFPPVKVLEEIAKYYCKKYGVPYKKFVKKLMTPADVEAIVRRAKITGESVDVVAQKVKLTYERYPNFKEIYSKILELGEPVWASGGLENELEEVNGNGMYW